MQAGLPFVSGMAGQSLSEGGDAVEGPTLGFQCENSMRSSCPFCHGVQGVGTTTMSSDNAGPVATSRIRNNHLHIGSSAGSYLHGGFLPTFWRLRMEHCDSTCVSQETATGGPLSDSVEEISNKAKLSAVEERTRYTTGTERD